MKEPIRNKSSLSPFYIVWMISITVNPKWIRKPASQERLQTEKPSFLPNLPAIYLIEIKNIVRIPNKMAKNTFNPACSLTLVS